MKLIVGLGNPGIEYQNTRHNLGFMVVDALAERLATTPLRLEKKFQAKISEQAFGGEKIILAKPQTMVNVSGEAVQKLKRFYTFDNADIWVISDDIDLEFGKIRFRHGGSSGGHNGLQSVIDKIGDDFGRIRVGVNNNSRRRMPAEQFVLRHFKANELSKLPQILETAVNHIVRQLEHGSSHRSLKVD